MLLDEREKISETIRTKKERGTKKKKKNRLGGKRSRWR